MQARLQKEPIRLSVISANRKQLGDLTTSVDASDVRDNLNGQRNRLASASMRQAYIGSEHTMR